MDLDIGMFTKFIKSTQWIYPLFSFIAHVHREYEYNFDSSDRRKSIVWGNKIVFVSYCNLVGDLLIAFCKDFTMSYERMLRAVAVIVSDKVESDDVLLKVLFNYLIAVHKIEYFEHLIVTHLNIFKTRSIKDIQIRVEAEQATNETEAELKKQILLALEEKRLSFNLQRKAADMLLSSEDGLDSQLAAKLKDGIFISLNGANVKDKLQAQQMQSKLGEVLPPIPDEVNSVKEQIAADQGITVVEMVEHRIKANQKWINDNMQEATANQKAKATNNSMKQIPDQIKCNQSKESQLFPLNETIIPSSVGSNAKTYDFSLSPEPIPTETTLSLEGDNKLSPTLEAIPDLFSATSFVSKTPKTTEHKAELLHVLNDDTKRESYLLQEHNYAMKLQLADLALIYNLELYCDINMCNREIVVNQNKYEREWNTCIEEHKPTKHSDFKKAQLAVKWVRKTFKKRYSVEYKPLVN